FRYKSSFYFAYHEWLSKEKGGGRTKRILKVQNCNQSSFRPLISYEVTFYTGDGSHAGTDANVSLILYGTLGDTGIRGLKQKGELTKLHIEHDNSMISPDWFLDTVEVINP
ncbi:unnamed protein product, partial [Adineta steineri]